MVEATAVKQEPSSKPKSHSKAQSDSKTSSSGGGGGGILDLLDSNSTGVSSTSGGSNTTAQHGNHVYDQNCDICTGKGPSSPPPAAATAATSSPNGLPEGSSEPSLASPQSPAEAMETEAG